MVKEEPKVSVVKLGHQPNPPNSIVVTELPIVSEPVKPSQPAKAQLPIVVTELGMVNEPVRPSASKNKYAGILCTVLPMVIVPVQFSKGLAVRELMSAQLTAF